MSRLDNHMSRLDNYSPLPITLILVSYFRLEQLSKEAAHSASQVVPVRRLRILRPLLWWGLLVAVLFAYRTHQRLMEQTRLLFTVSLQGASVLDESATRVDGRPISSGDQIRLGWHTFSVSHPKAVLFSSNLFIWYGPHDFGNINLKRATGVLEVSAVPLAPVLSIKGPEWDLTLSNSSGVTRTLPTDDYIVTLRYRYLEEGHPVRVLGDVTNTLHIAPRFGALQLSCNQSNATFQLLRPDGESVEAGDFPAAITGLPEGTYNLVARHHDHLKTETARVTAPATNSINTHFEYGAAVLETSPVGASVTTADEHDWGSTPLTIPELEPGRWTFNLRLNNYETATVRMEIAANATNTIHTNLLNLSYARAMSLAREAMASRDYDRASASLVDALRAVPDDSAAIALEREALGLGHLARAKILGDQGHYTAGRRELEKAVARLPQNVEAQQLLADFKQHEQDQAARQKQANIEALKKVFDSFTGTINGAAFAETHQLKTSKPVRQVESAMVDQFRTVSPKFNLPYVAWTNETTFCMNAEQEVSGGGRLCMIVGGSITDEETVVLFKVIEFKGEALGIKILGTMLGAATSTKFNPSYHPINPSSAQLSDSDKSRIAEGVRVVTERIQHAIK